MIGRLIASVAVLVLLGVPNAAAHKPSDSYLTVTLAGRATIRWDIALRDLELIVGLDDDVDGNITWGELRSRSDTIDRTARNSLTVTVDGQPRRLSPGPIRVTDHTDGGYAVLDFDAGPIEDDGRVRLTYDLLFDIDPTHRGLASIRNRDATSVHIFDPDHRTLDIKVGHTPRGTLATYFLLGVEHIFEGYDHILFLLALLLPSVLTPGRSRVSDDAADADAADDRRRSGSIRRRPVRSFRVALVGVVRLVSMFTLAHTLTLWLATTGWVDLPSRWVESVIAASIIVAAADNLLPRSRLPGWPVAFGFGLIHGFGFAGVLSGLNVDPSTRLTALLGFNLGVEAGQLLIVAVFLPIAYALRHRREYRRWVLRGGSVLIIALAAVWLVERVADVAIIS